MASLAMNPQQEQTTSDAISAGTQGANTAATKANQLWGNLRNEMGNVTQQMKDKQAEFEQTKENLKARANETKANAQRKIQQKQADLEEYKAANAAIQAQGQHAYLSHGWSGLKKEATKAKQKAIEAKKTLEREKVVFDNANAAAHEKAKNAYSVSQASFDKLGPQQETQAGQTVSGMTTGPPGTSFEASGGRRRRRRRKSRRKKKSKKKKGGRKSRKKKRKRKTRKKRRRRNRKKSRRRRRR